MNVFQTFVNSINSNLINKPQFCQQSYQLTNPTFKLVNRLSNLPLLDIFPKSKNP